MPLRTATDCDVADTVVLGSESTIVKLERHAAVGDFAYLEGQLHVKDRASIGPWSSLTGDVVLHQDTQVQSRVLIEGTVNIGPRSKLGSNSSLIGTVSVGRDANIGPSSQIIGQLSEVETNSGRVEIGNSTIIGPGCTILPGSIIGSGSIVESGARYQGILPPDSYLSYNGKIKPITEIPSGTVNDRSPRHLPRKLIRRFDQISAEAGVHHYRRRLSDDLVLDFLLVNKGADKLVVSLHGAVDRKKGSAPRYEWLKTLSDEPYNCLFVSDPALAADPGLRLGWFLGNETVDLPYRLSQLIHQAQIATNSDDVVIVGLSGGGFAALQVGAKLPEAKSLVFNPRTEIPISQADGSIWWTFYAFLRSVEPALAPPKAQSALLKSFWDSSLAKRTSARSTYSYPLKNTVFYYTNTGEPYHHQEYAPFRDSVHPLNDVRVREYDAGTAHTAPSLAIFRSALNEAFNQ